MDRREHEVRRLLERYLVEVVEAFELCPWARPARLAGELAVAIAWGEPAEAAWLAAAARLLGEASALRESAGAPLPEAEMGDINRAAGTIMAAIGVAPFRSEFEHGRARVRTEGAP
ncbi:MAG TPA: hypothetical protein VFV01_06365 [Spirillospora sp.]|nr:hypothetical protein [Spirillospora sp.]